MPRFDPSPWNLGLSVWAIAAACGPVIPLEPMGPTSLGEPDADVPSTTDGGMSTDGIGCNPACAPGYICDAGACVPEYGCLEFGCCYGDPCCGEGGYGCGSCFYVHECYAGEFCEYQLCVPLDVPTDCEDALELVEVLGPTPIEVAAVFSLAFVEADDDAARELVIGHATGAVLVGGLDGPAQVLPVPDQGLVEDIAVADFDLDGREDIAISMTPQAALPRLVVLRNIGDGTFFAVELETSAAFDIATGDVDGDALPDIVGALDAGVEYRPLGVLRNIGGFAFEPAFLDIDAEPLDIDLGDLDATGFSDVVGVDNVQQQVWFGDAPFDNAADWAISDVPYLAVQVAVADFNGDGYDELVRLTTVQDWTLVDSWTPSAGAIVEIPEWGWPTQVMHGSAQAGDLDGDGLADLVGLWGSALYVRFGAPMTEVFGCTAQVSLSISPHVIALGDFTGDGRDDVAVSDGTVVHVYAEPRVAPP